MKIRPLQDRVIVKRIEEEARRMLASHAGRVKQAGEADPYKMFLLIKQKLAQKKGFVL